LREFSKLQPALTVNINILFGLRPEIRGEVAIKHYFVGKQDLSFLIDITHLRVANDYVQSLPDLLSKVTCVV
jgi:hypothetical protein